MRITIRGRVVAIKDELYTSYVFRNFDEQDNSLMRYVTVVKCPNWMGTSPQLNDVGYVEYEYVEAGDTYFDRNSGNSSIYNYTSCYFINFIKENEKIECKEFKF